MAIETDRLIAPDRESPQEDAVERALRPRRLAEYVGQQKIKEQMAIFIEAAKPEATESVSTTPDGTSPSEAIADRDVLDLQLD